MTVTPSGTTKVPLSVCWLTRENGCVTVMSPVPTSDAPPTVLSVTVPAVPLIESTPAVTFRALTHAVPLYVRSRPVLLLTYALPATSGTPPRPVAGSDAAAPSQRASSDARRRASALAADALPAASSRAPTAVDAAASAAWALLYTLAAMAFVCGCSWVFCQDRNASKAASKVASLSDELGRAGPASIGTGGVMAIGFFLTFRTWAVHGFGN